MYTSTATQLNVDCERIYEASTEALAGFFRHTTFSIASCVVSGGLSNVSHSDVYPLCSSSSSCALPLSQWYELSFSQCYHTTCVVSLKEDKKGALTCSSYSNV